MEYENDVKPTALVCMRVGNPDAVLVKGTTKTRCTQCNHEVWIAPRSVQFIIDHPIPVWCSDCALVIAEAAKAVAGGE